MRAAAGLKAWSASWRVAEDAGVLPLPASVFRSGLAPLLADRFRIGFGRMGFAAGLDALEAMLRRQASQRRDGCCNF